MKIVTWNCNGAFRNKFANLGYINADVYIIQECENPAKSNHKEYIQWAENYLWIGDNKNRGIGVFARQTVHLSQLNWSNNYKDHSVKHFLPFRLNKKLDFVAVWNHHNNSPNFGYIGQFWKYLQVNKEKMSKSIIAGDFNSNAIWDEWDRWWNHSDVVKELKEIGIESLYHLKAQEVQGKELQPTFFLQKKLRKPYHIDYIFTPTEYAAKCNYFEVETPEKWLNFSDHVPLICNIEI